MFYGAAHRAIRTAIERPAAREDLVRVWADYFWLALNSSAYHVRRTPRAGAVASMTGDRKSVV